jgi:sorting nexin-1/2
MPRQSEMAKTMVLEMHDIKCNDGIMKLEIVHTESKGVGMKKFTQYLIKGSDSLGEINCFRRYSEFLVFRDFLYSRYPGLFIPPVPTKQSKGNMTEWFIEERKYYLTEFLIKLCEFRYLCKTPEVQVFFRPKGKVEESFKSLSKTSTEFVLQWYKSNIPISDIDLPEPQI